MTLFLKNISDANISLGASYSYLIKPGKVLKVTCKETKNMASWFIDKNMLIEVNEDGTPLACWGNKKEIVL